MDPPETFPSRADLRRAGLVICIGLICAGGTYLLFELVARLSSHLAFLLQPEVQLTCSIGLGIGLSVFGAYRLPEPVWSGWLGIALLALPPLSCAGLLAPMTLHTNLGTPILGCAREGMSVDTCEGRDWSFLQDRLTYERATGEIDESLCRAFVERVPATAADPVDGRGWVRCPYDDPSVWAAQDCAELGIAGRSQCFVCSGRSRTSDTFTYVQAFDSDCRQTTITYGANVPPRDIDECQRSNDRHDCLAVVWGER